MKTIERCRNPVALRCLVACTALAVVGCASAPPRSLPEIVDSSSAPSLSGYESARQSGAPAQREPWHDPEQRSGGLPWVPGQPLMHGFLGITSLESVSVDGADGDQGDLDQSPLIGGGAQWKLGGKGIDFGLEGLLGFSGSANAAAIAVGGGGALVAVDVNMLLFDLYGGPFASVFLGDKLRVYGAFGPLLEWASWDQSGAIDDSGSGFGAGTYARTGFEFVLPSRVLVGFGVRWSDTSVDLGGSLGDLDIQGLQYQFTVSRGL